MSNKSYTCYGAIDIEVPTMHFSIFMGLYEEKVKKNLSSLIFLKKAYGKNVVIHEFRILNYQILILDF